MIQNLSMNSLNNFCIISPNEEKHQKIIQYLDTKYSEVNKKIILKEELFVDLENYKKSLICEYITRK